MWEERVEGKDDTRLGSDMKQWNIRGTLGRMMNIKKKWERIEGAGNKRKRLEGGKKSSSNNSASVYVLLRVCTRDTRDNL